MEKIYPRSSQQVRTIWIELEMYMLTISVFISYTKYTMKKIIGLLAIASLSLLMIAGCTDKNSIKAWDTVSITYIATFPDGQAFDQNTEQTPLTFIVGSWQVIQGLDEGIVGMKLGKTNTISIKPEKWYGKLYDTNNIQKISQLIFDKLSVKIENGAIQRLGNIEGIVKWTEKDTEGNVLVLFDINPRQTRDTLKYTVTVLSKK